MSMCRVLVPGAAMLLALSMAAAAFAQPASFAPIVREQRAKVVHINTNAGGAGGRPTANEPFRFPDSSRGSGSGFIISADGFIVTNHHVVENTDTIEVVLSDDRKFTARLVGQDAQTDLALLKIDAQRLPVVNFGDSARLEVGDWVIAIGNPLGLDHTVTAGIISAKGRNIFNDDNLAYGEFLQTDAAINPGNSGGPLFNLAGEVIGVNSAISRKGQGIGFAVPSNLVVQIIPQLRTLGRVNRGWLGVVILELNREMASRLVLPGETRGVLIDEILPGSPAPGSGLRRGDVLTVFGVEPLRRVPQLQKLVALTPPGSEVEVQGLRRDSDAEPWKPIRLRLSIGLSPAAAAAAQPSALARLGVATMNIPDELRRRIALDTQSGVLVESVAPGGAAEEAGLEAGDIILEVGRNAVSSRSELEAALLRATTARIPLVVRREQRILYLVIERSDLHR